MRLVGTNIHYVPFTADEVQVPTEEATGKGLKRILPIVASFIVPVAAPWIAAKVGLSGALSGALSGVIGKTVGAVAGRTLAGSLTGAALGAITGTGAGRGALMGGIGAFTGMGSTTSRTSMGTPIKTGLSGPSVPSGGIPKTGSPMAATTSRPLTSIAGSPVTAGPKPLITSASGSPPTNSVANPSVAGASSVGNTSGSVTSPNAPVVTAPTAPPAPAGTPLSGTTPSGAPTGVGGIARSIGKRLGDPDLILRAAQFLASGALPGDPDLDRLIQQQAAALETLRTQDEAAYQLQLQQAQQLLATAQGVDPLAIAREYAAMSKAETDAATRQAEREAMAESGGRETGRREAVRQAGLLRGAELASQAFNRGYSQGQGAKVQATSAAAQATPRGPTNYASGLAGLFTMEQLYEQDRAARAQGAGTLFGNAFGNISGAPRWT